MAKSKAGRNKGYVSKGVHSNTSRATKRMVRQGQDYGSPLHKLRCYLKGQNPWITIENPNKNETNRRFIKVKANEHYGSLRDREAHSYKMGSK